MLKKRKRRKVNRRHTEPGLGGGSGARALAVPLEGDAESATIAPPLSAIPSGSNFTGTPTAASSSSARSRRGDTALRTDAAIGAAQFTLHTQVGLSAPPPISSFLIKVISGIRVMKWRTITFLEPSVLRGIHHNAPFKYLGG